MKKNRLLAIVPSPKGGGVPRLPARRISGRRRRFLGNSGGDMAHLVWERGVFVVTTDQAPVKVNG
jgi:hypothetical protein